MTRILLRFPEKIVNQPIISRVVLEYSIPINILAAHVDSHGGVVLIETAQNDTKRAVKAFREKGVIVAFPKLIEVDEEKCVHCGACRSLCPVDAISVDPEDAAVKFDAEKCIGSVCGLCVDACPVRAINLSREMEFLEQNENQKFDKGSFQH